MIHSIDHVQIPMPAGGEEKARTFYTHLLGFDEIPKPAELTQRGGVWFQSGVGQIKDESQHKNKCVIPKNYLPNVN